MAAEGTSAFNKILALCSTHSEPMRKETIARQIDAKVNTVALILTKMRRAGFMQETNSFWSITPDGKELFQINPNASPATHLKNGENGSRVLWAELLNKELVTNSCVCDAACYMPEWRERLDYHSDIIDIFFFLWLVKERHITEFDFPKEMTPTSLDHYIANWLNQKDYKEKA